MDLLYEVNLLCKHAGVYKCNEQGLKAFEKFLEIL